MLQLRSWWAAEQTLGKDINVQPISSLYHVPGKSKVRIVLADLCLSVNWWSKFKRADFPKFVLNEGLIIVQLLLRHHLCFRDFCTRSSRICLEALLFATFLWVKLWIKYCRLLSSVGKFKRDLPVVTENFFHYKIKYTYAVVWWIGSGGPMSGRHVPRDL